MEHAFTLRIKAIFFLDMLNIILQYWDLINKNDRTGCRRRLTRYQSQGGLTT